MSTQLFLDTSIPFIKVAAGALLEVDPEMWPTEILKIAHKELPFLQRCELDVELDRVDPLRGYAVGKILLYPARMAKEAAAGQDKLLSMPVVVRNRELSPLDVYSYKGAMHPMDDDTVNEILFVPDTFEHVAPKGQFTGSELASQLAPPTSSHQYGGSSLNKSAHEKTAMWPFKKKKKGGKATLGSAAAVGNYLNGLQGGIQQTLHKPTGTVSPFTQQGGRTGIMTAAGSFQPVSEQAADDFMKAFAQQKQKKASVDLLKVAAHTFRDADVEAFRQQVMGHPGLRYNYANNEMLRGATETIFAVKEKTAAEKRANRRAATKPTVVQFVEHGKGYFLKTANHHAYAPTVREVSRFDAQKMLSETSMKRLLKVGHVTLTSDPVMTTRPMTKSASAADRFGIYRVWDGAQPKEGMVVSRMVGVDGRVLDAQVFLGEDAHAMQEKIAGSFERTTTLAGSHARGKGVFVYQEGNRAVATEPIEVLNEISTSYDGEKVAYYNARRMATGEPLRIYRVPGLQKLAALGDGELHIPARMVFCALAGKQTTVASNTNTVDMLEQQKLASHSSATLVSDGASYEIRGRNARVFDGDMMTADAAAFALGALGVTGRQSEALLKVAASSGSVTVTTTRPVVSELAKGRDELIKAAHFVRSMPSMKTDLVNAVAILTEPASMEMWKEAASGISSETANTILSLNFVNPENAAIYVNYLPSIEKVSSVLAELLVASRLGLSDIRESAALNAMKQVQKVAKDLGHLREKIQ